MQQTEFEQNAARRLSLDRAARAVTQGQVILYPTETFYAIGCGAFHPHAAELVSQIKTSSARQTVSSHSWVCGATPLGDQLDVGHLAPSGGLFLAGPAVHPGPGTGNAVRSRA